jgi:hypothetical protein
MGLFDWPITKKMLTIFGHSENSHIVFLWANYIGYKRRTLGAMDMGTKCGAIGNTHFQKKKKNKIPIALLWLSQ